MGVPSHLQFRRTGSDCALAIQPVAAVLTELFPREVVIKEYRGTAGASVAVFEGFRLGFGQLTRRIIHMESPQLFTSNIGRLVGGSCVVRHNQGPHDFIACQESRAIRMPHADKKSFQGFTGNHMRLDWEILQARAFLVGNSARFARSWSRLSSNLRAKFCRL